jgi:predicted enzyme related to lactoylglutathione lyase
MVAGLLPTPEGLDLPPRWGVYITVEDVDAAAKLSGDLGGTVCLAPRDILNVGRYASLRSPQGVSFHVIHYSF